MIREWGRGKRAMGNRQWAMGKRRGAMGRVPTIGAPVLKRRLAEDGQAVAPGTRQDMKIGSLRLRLSLVYHWINEQFFDDNQFWATVPQDGAVGA